MIKDKDDELSEFESPPSYNQVVNFKEYRKSNEEKALYSESCRSMPPTPPDSDSDRFHVIKSKLKQNTPATQALPVTRRNPKEVGNLLIIVVLFMTGCVTVLYFITPLAEQAGMQQASKGMPDPPLPPLSVYFVVSGSVPISPAAIMMTYQKYLPSAALSNPSGDDFVRKTDHVIQFQNVEFRSLVQTTRLLLAGELMNVGVASAKIRTPSTMTLLCSSLFISEYCGQTWSASGCPAGMTGATCSDCLPARFGASCMPCPNTCEPHGVCDGIRGVGQCICESGWSGPSCAQPVP